ncbi:MAG: type II toxin-antitoxin system PemK/MazF family toxin [Psychroflexus sp.]|uniref:type II toxin-antitoxin system PemK/MazF family toxin n=1 Tax=Psychroflexus sp. S27 TaxID=1982757 RepID=UPI000C2A2428|nr:type II toxin-antitoxin system PemK/MazF family toxin [Psychroflexus sp. S27]PJX22871.1 transcription elongation factor GreAB [Psychroflexus sp. S27]
MKQGDIWNVYFDPIKGSEQGGNRPAVVISGNTLNKNLGVIVVCPLSTAIHNYEGNPVLIPTKENGLKLTSEILVFHIRSLSKERFKIKIGEVTKEELEKVKQTVLDILKY